MKNKIFQILTSNKIVRNIFWLFFDKVLRMGLGIVVSIYLAKYLGPKDYGELSFCISFLYFFLVISMLGMEPILVREFTNNSTRTNQILSTSLILRIFSGLFLFIIISIIAFFSFEWMRFLFITIISFQLLLQAIDVLGSLFLAKVQSKYVVIAKNAGFVISSLIKLLLVFLDVDLIIFAYSILLEFLLAAIFIIIFFRKEGYKVSWSLFDRKLAKKILTASYPLILSGIFYVIYTKLDQVMVEFLSSSEEVGYYAVASRLSEVWFFIPTAVVNSFYSEIIFLKCKNIELFRARLLQLMTLLSFLALLIILFFVFFGHMIIITLYGYEYENSVNIFKVHIFSCLIVFSAVVSGVWYVANDLQKYTFYRTGAGAIVNIILNLFLIPIFGGLGAAFATLFAKVLASYLMNLMNSKTKEVFYLQTKGYSNVLRLHPVLVSARQVLIALK